MYIIKNAFRCIGRSKGRNVLIGIIVLVIAVSACIGLSIRQAAQSAREETLAGMSVTATISIDRQSMMGNMTAGGGKFDREQFAGAFGNTATLTLEEYKKYAAAESVEDFYYSATASFNGDENLEPVSTEEETEDGGQQGNMFGGRPGGNRMNMSSGDFTVTGYSSDAAMTSFINGVASISEGAVFEEGTEEYNCIISKELATFNELSVGSVINITNPNSEQEVYALTVVGIYSDTEANEEFQAMPGQDPANNIYISYAALEKIINSSAEVSTTVTDSTTNRQYETKVTGNLTATYIFESPEKYYLFEQEVRDLGLGESYSVSSQDISAFESSLVPLDTLSQMAGWFLIVILVIGVVILIVLNIFNIRERKYEIGVLMAIGMKKRNVALQFLTEIFAVTLAAVIIGIGIGAVSAVPVTNGLLQNQIASAENEQNQVSASFGRPEGSMQPGGSFGGMQAPPTEDMGGGFKGMENIFGEKAANYVSEINSAMNFTVVLQMLGIAVLLTLIAGTVGVMFVMRYEPLKILANRD